MTYFYALATIFVLHLRNSANLWTFLGVPISIVPLIAVVTWDNDAEPGFTANSVHIGRRDSHGYVADLRLLCRSVAGVRNFMRERLTTRWSRACR